MDALLSSWSHSWSIWFHKSDRWKQLQTGSFISQDWKAHAEKMRNFSSLPLHRSARDEEKDASTRSKRHQFSSRLWDAIYVMDVNKSKQGDKKAARSVVPHSRCGLCPEAFKSRRRASLIWRRYSAEKFVRPAWSTRHERFSTPLSGSKSNILHLS